VGSSDIFGWRGGVPGQASIFITVHDGFTLQDLVSFSDKHNEANSETITTEMMPTSAGITVRGADFRSAIVALRDRQKRNLLPHFFCSLGVPMLLRRRRDRTTQRGNNNAYCQAMRFVVRLEHIRPEDEIFAVSSAI